MRSDNPGAYQKTQKHQSERSDLLNLPGAYSNHGDRCESERDGLHLARVSSFAGGQTDHNLLLREGRKPLLLV